MYKKILVINPFGIGDVLFTTPIIHTLKDAFSGLKLGYLCNRRTAEILKANPYVDAIFVYERDEFEAANNKSFFLWIKKLTSFLNEIKKYGFELAVDFSLNTQYGFFSWYAGIKERIGYDFKKRGRFLTKKISLSGYNEKHIVEYYAELLKYLGLSLKYRNLELYLSEADKSQAGEILSKTGLTPSDLLVGIVPGGGASWGKDAQLKHWPPEKFAQLADNLMETYKAKIIILGDFSEQEIAQSVIKNMQHKAINLAGVTTIGKMSALLSKTNLVITNDGGPLHMAVALGIKTVSIFGPVDPRVYGPYPADERRHIVLRKIIECSPCYRNFRLEPCKSNRECLETITVQEASNAAARLLN